MPITWVSPGLAQPPVSPYPRRSRCWCCGRFAKVRPWVPQRDCPSCGVQWRETPAGVKPRHLANREVELLQAKSRFLPRSVTGRPWDIFDDFLDHAENSVPSPA